ncbi:hypothetical protein [Nonomuraea lactucae]|uniref:hypothetical protein n=1 Tax=Nonomuraea lactucae TaxID=2249762 RepID=UPI0019656D18|nr:hypothetical protein [Nonomuraea lactucae]
MKTTPRGLNWRDAKHWGGTRKPCIHCGRATPLRDDHDRPAHKVCAENAEATR